LIRLLKPKEAAIKLPVETEEPLDGPSTPAPAPAHAHGHAHGKHTSHHNTTLRFDLALARGSLLVDLVAYSVMPLAPTGTAFIGAAVGGAFGGGFGPAVQAVALELFARRPDGSAAQAGRLFGALSVLTASVSQVLGPALFGGVYFASVRAFPEAIFVLSALLVLLSLVLLMCVRLPQDGAGADAEVGGLEREATAVADEEEDGARGRKVTATAAE
jgi:hypothetical protein